jgi:hypothetical protein
MRVYLASSADELKEFFETGELSIDEVYAPTDIYSSTHPDMDEEEIEYSLSLLAAEDSLELRDEFSGSPLVLAFEIGNEALGAFDEVTAQLLTPLRWDCLEAIFIVGDDADDLTWFAPQETENSLPLWLKG